MRRPNRSRSKQRGHDVDVAVRRLGVRTDFVRGLDKVLRDRALDARHADVQSSAQEEGAADLVQIDLGIDFRMGGELDLLLGGGEFDCAQVAGRPGGTEEISAAGWGCGSFTSRKPSLLRAAPSGPAVTWVVPVKRTLAATGFSMVVVMANSFG